MLAFDALLSAPVRAAGDAAFVQQLITLELTLAAVTAVATACQRAPYGRHDTKDKSWGPRIGAALGWVVMEAVSVWWFLYIYSSAGAIAWAFKDARSVLAAAWLTHYVYRSFIYPVRAYGWPWERKGKTMPLLVAVLAFCFNLLNAFINAAWLGHHAKFSLQHAASLDFVVGLLLWALGLAANVMCDEMMLAQRRASKRRGEGAKERAEPLRRTSSAPPHEQASKQDQPKKHVRVAAAFGYIIPSGFLFELVSAPNYLSEIVEWTGFAAASQSPAALAFSVYVCSNLVPRALDHHDWYKAMFGDEYPKKRHAIIPFLL